MVSIWWQLWRLMSQVHLSTNFYSEIHFESGEGKRSTMRNLLLCRLYLMIAITIIPMIATERYVSFVNSTIIHHPSVFKFQILDHRKTYEEKRTLFYLCQRRKFSINLQFFISVQQMQHEKHPIKAKKTFCFWKCRKKISPEPSLVTFSFSVFLFFVVCLFVF